MTLLSICIPCYGRVEYEKQHIPRKKSIVQPEQPKVNLLVDIQAKLQAGKGAGYALSLIHI